MQKEKSQNEPKFPKSQKTPKVITPEMLIEIIKPGNKIYIGSACSEPLIFSESIVEYLITGRLYDVVIMHFFKVSNQKLFCRDFPSRFRYNTLSIIGSPEMRDAINQGYSDFTPIKSSEINKMLKGKRYKIDVALIQVSPPDKYGFCSLGINVDINRTIVEVADIIVAQINPNMPRTHGNSFIKFNSIDYFLNDDKILEIQPPKSNKMIKSIAKYITRLIDCGSTINIGVGKIAYALPEAILEADIKDLAFYSEVLPESIIDLIENGNVNCSKNYFKQIMTSFIMGTKRFYNYVDNNPIFSFQTTEFLLNIENIIKNRKFCSIYGALMVDLLGQVTNHGGKQDTDLFYGGIGGEADFMHASTISKDGKSIIAMPSTTSSGKSRIVSLLPSGGITLRMIDVHYVVTEYGIAYLHGKTIRERVLQMIGIAHPDHRQDLLKKAKKYNYIYQDQKIPMTEDGCVVICPDMEWDFETKSKGTIHFAPVKPTDERMMQELYYNLSEKDRTMRFFAPQKIFSHEETQSRIICDYETCMVIIGIAGKKEENQRIVAAGAYYLEPYTNTVEFSATISEEYRKQGIAKHILLRLIESAEEKGYKGMFGTVLENNAGMLKLLRSISNKVIFTKEDEDTILFQIDF